MEEKTDKKAAEEGQGKSQQELPPLKRTRRNQESNHTKECQQEQNNADIIRGDKDERQGEEEKEVEEKNEASHGNGKDSAVSSTINVDNEGQVSEANIA